MFSKILAVEALRLHTILVFSKISAVEALMLLTTPASRTSTTTDMDHMLLMIYETNTLIPAVLPLHLMAHTTRGQDITPQGHSHPVLRTQALE